MSANCSSCGRQTSGGSCGFCGGKPIEKPYKPKSGEHWGGRPPKTDPKKR